MYLLLSRKWLVCLTEILAVLMSHHLIVAVWLFLLLFRRCLRSFSLSCSFTAMLSRRYAGILALSQAFLALDVAVAIAAINIDMLLIDKPQLKNMVFISD